MNIFTSPCCILSFEYNTYQSPMFYILVDFECDGAYQLDENPYLEPLHLFILHLKCRKSSQRQGHVSLLYRAICKTVQIRRLTKVTQCIVFRCIYALWTVALLMLLVFISVISCRSVLRFRDK